MNDELKEYYEIISRLYSMVRWCFSGCEREILEDKIDEIIDCLNNGDK